MVSSHAEFLHTDHQIRKDLVLNTRLTGNRMDVLLQSRAMAIGNLSALAATLSPAQMQPRLEQTHHSDANFLRIGLLDKEAVATAFTPTMDELGITTVGKSFADRPFIPRLKQTLKPMLS
jgi:hypothetical protein